MGYFFFSNGFQNRTSFGNSLLSQSNWLQPSNASCPLLGWCPRASCHMHGVALLYFPLTNLLRKLTAHVLSQGVVWTILPCLCHLLSRIIVSNWLVLVPPVTTKGIYHNDGTNELYGQSSANTAPCRPFRLLLPCGGRLTGKLCSWIWAKGLHDFWL